MSFRERVLYHQVHPIKLGADVGTAIIALWLLAHHRLLIALLVMFVPPILVSLNLLFFVDLSPIRDSPLGTYLRKHMTRSAEGARLAGMATTSIGAWQHWWWLMALGAFLIAASWTWGLSFGKLNW